TETPASACRRNPMICSSLNRLVFMSIILHRDGLHELHRGTAGGEQVKVARSFLYCLYWLFNQDG
ncbi:MAG: hypothetical protein KGL33_09145, partial [Betaproteobacteria bacterium]|nr:hypothetical protein [Betaproteobacteria bacterium]